MKKTLAWVCLLAMLFSFGALGETRLFSVNDYESSYTFSFAQAGDTIFLFTTGYAGGDPDEGVCRIAAPYQKPSDLMEYSLGEMKGQNVKFCSDGENLWAWKTEEGMVKVWQVTFDEGSGLTYKIKSQFPMVQALDELEMDNVPTRGLYVNGVFFGCITDFETGGMWLAAYDIAEKNLEVFDTDADGITMNVVSVLPYSENSVLVISAEEEGESLMHLYELSLDGLKLNQLATVPVNYPSMTFGFAYDSTEQALFFTTESNVYQLTNFDPDSLTQLTKFSGDFSSNNWVENNNGALTEDGYYIVSNGETLVAYNLAGGEEVTADDAGLAILGGGDEYFEYAVGKYDQAHPGSSVRIDLRSEVDFDLTGALNAHSDDYDIYILKVNSSEYGALYDRGFLRPMENEAIQDFVATLYPNLMDAVTLDGNVVALPLEMGCYTIAYNPNVLEELGYTTEELPASWPEMMRFLANLAPRLEDTDYTAFCADQWVSLVRNNLAGQILNAACQKIHETGTGELNTPEMVEMLDTLAGIDFEALGAKASRDDEGEDNEDMYLFDIDGNVNVNQGTTEFVPLMLSLEEGGEPMTPAEIAVAVVNPYSRNPQAAEEFLATLIDELPDTTRVNFCRDWEGGVKTENADELIADNDAEIAMIQEGLDNAKDEDEKAGYQQQLEDAQASRDWIMEKFYWDISEDAVKQYQQNEQYVMPARYLGLSVSEDLGPILQKCMEGTCDGATALKEMDGKLQMMMQENQ